MKVHTNEDSFLHLRTTLTGQYLIVFGQNCLVELFLKGTQLHSQYKFLFGWHLFQNVLLHSCKQLKSPKIKIIKIQPCISKQVRDEINYHLVCNLIGYVSMDSCSTWWQHFAYCAISGVPTSCAAAQPAPPD